jgi:hypothetical protein
VGWGREGKGWVKVYTDQPNKSIIPGSSGPYSIHELKILAMNL